MGLFISITPKLNFWQIWSLLIFLEALVLFTIYFSIYAIRLYRSSKMRIKGAKTETTYSKVIIDDIRTNRSKGEFFDRIDKARERSDRYRPDALRERNEKSIR